MPEPTRRQEDSIVPYGDAQEADAEVSLANCGNLYTFNLTVKFTATHPSREAPLGTDRVPASLGGGS